jgi:chromosome partitioning protein
MSEALDAGQRPYAPEGVRATHIVTICSPKGGVGKTTLARSLLVAAAQAGIQSIGLDFDRQGSLRKWAIRRAATRSAFPDQFVSAEVVEADLHDWRGSLRRIKDYDLAIIDTPPSVEEHLPAIQGLCHEAKFVVVPTGYTQDDLDSVVPWMQTVNESGARAAFCLNRANRRTSIFARSRAKLIKVGAVCPVEIPLLEDVHAHADSGLTVLDIAKSRGLEPMEAVWDFVRREVGL